MKKGIKFMVAALSVLALVGCGDKATEETSTAGSKIEGSKIKAYFSAPSGKPEAVEEVEKSIEEYTKKTYGYEVDVIFFDGAEYGEKTNVIMTAGEDWDIMYSNNHSAATAFTKWAKDGGFLDIGPYENTTLKPVVDIVGKDIIDAVKINGKAYAIKANPETTFGSVFWFDPAVLKKVGITDFDPTVKVDSIFDYEPMFEKIVQYNKANGTEIIPLIGLDRITLGYDNYDFVSGVPFRMLGITLDGEKVESFFETEQFRNLQKKVGEYYTKGYLYYDPNKPVSLAKNEWGFWPGNGPKERRAAALQMTGSIGKELDAAYMKSYLRRVTASITDMLFVVNANTKAPEAATKFIADLYTDKFIANTLQYGIEGKHWEFTDKNAQLVKRLDPDTYFGDMWWGLGGNYTNLYKLESLKDVEYAFGKPTPDESNPEITKTAKSLGFFFDPEPVRIEIAGLSNVAAKYSHVTRGLPKNWDSEYEKFITELKAAGLDKVKAEVEKQYAEWKKTR